MAYTESDLSNIRALFNNLGKASTFASIRIAIASFNALSIESPFVSRAINTIEQRIKLPGENNLPTGEDDEEQFTARIRERAASVLTNDVISITQLEQRDSEVEEKNIADLVSRSKKLTVAQEPFTPPLTPPGSLSSGLSHDESLEGQFPEDIANGGVITDESDDDVSDWTMPSDDLDEREQDLDDFTMKRSSLPPINVSSLDLKAVQKEQYTEQPAGHGGLVTDSRDDVGSDTLDELQKQQQLVERMKAYYKYADGSRSNANDIFGKNEPLPLEMVLLNLESQHFLELGASAASTLQVFREDIAGLLCPRTESEPNLKQVVINKIKECYSIYGDDKAYRENQNAYRMVALMIGQVQDSNYQSLRNKMDLLLEQICTDQQLGRGSQRYQQARTICCDLLSACAQKYADNNQRVRYNIVI